MTDKSSKTNQETSNQLQEIDAPSVAENSSPGEKTETKVEKSKKVKNRLKKEKQPFSIIATSALFISVLISAALVYVYFLLQDLQQINTNFSGSQNSLEQQIKNTKQELSMEIQARNKSESEFRSFKIAMEALATKLGRTSNEWRLAEIEYLLTIANHRITLARDLATAIAIFDTADQRIKVLGDPALLKIRKTIKEELTLLHAVQEPDVAGLALSLGSLVGAVEQLPLIDKERVAAATGQVKNQVPESWKDIPAVVWKDIKSLVVVRRHQKATEPLLPPSESWFLYQNLQLKLEQARLALLRRDTALFHQNLNEANAWISTYFNEESSVVIKARNKLSELEKINLQTSIPDTSSSLRQLRSLLIERGVRIGAR